MERLAYIGKILTITPIEGADRVEQATVVCGKGGRWEGVVPKGAFLADRLCRVFLPDCIVPQIPEFEFMAQHKHRVKMRRFRGVPSEALIMTMSGSYTEAFALGVGADISDMEGCTKHEKPIPVGMGGETEGGFPSFISKTDEMNFQQVPELVEDLRGRMFVATEKADGTSTTAYFYEGHFGVCGRNWERKDTIRSVLWHVAKKYKVHELLPKLGRNLALQWETVGPGIQGNPMKLKEPDMRLFDVYDIEERRYFFPPELWDFANFHNLPTVKIVGGLLSCLQTARELMKEEREHLQSEWKGAQKERGAVAIITTGIEFKQYGIPFSMGSEELRKFAEGEYAPGIQREGVVIRSLHAPRISFKVVNLLYKG